MTELRGYDYRELAYDLYKEGDDLLAKLVAIRNQQNMTQDDLAEKMNVSQGYISKIENGNTNMISLLIDYALEVGARLHIEVEPAQKYSEEERYTSTFTTQPTTARVLTSWGNQSFTIEDATKQSTYTVKSNSRINISDLQELLDTSEMTSTSDQKEIARVGTL